MRASKVDLRQAISCLEENRNSLAHLGGMLRPNVANDGFGEAVGKLNVGVMNVLRTQVKEARILSILVLEKMNATHEQIPDFPGQCADLLTALNQLKIATDKAAAAQSEFLRQTAADTADETESPGANAIREFRRRRGQWS